MEQEKKTNIGINVELAKHLKAHCAINGISMRDFVENLIRVAISK
jgi:hypothetical protein